MISGKGREDAMLRRADLYKVESPIWDIQVFILYWIIFRVRTCEHSLKKCDSAPVEGQ